MEEKPICRDVFECLEKVTDYKLFRTFLWTVVEEREAAEEMQREEPEKWQWGDASNWQNLNIDIS
jgi:hypothetical protein